MNAKQFKSVVLEKDSFGNVTKVLEIQCFDTQTIHEYKQQALKTQEKCDLATKVAKEENDKKSKEMESVITNLKYVLAYQQFRDLVEKGLRETTEEFESMYTNYLLGASFDISVAPYGYKEVLERLK